jgi:hypothetical protein
MCLCAIARALGIYLGDVTAATAGVSSTASYDVLDLSADGSPRASTARRDHQFP